MVLRWQGSSSLLLLQKEWLVQCTAPSLPTASVGLSDRDYRRSVKDLRWILNKQRRRGDFEPDVVTSWHAQSVVYLVVHIPSGNQYIGQTGGDVMSRLKEHYQERNKRAPPEELTGLAKQFRQDDNLRNYKAVVLRVVRPKPNQSN
jgi:hypothetical protein